MEEVEWWVCLICPKMGDVFGMEQALKRDWEKMEEDSCVVQGLLFEKVDGLVGMEQDDTLGELE